MVPTVAGFLVRIKIPPSARFSTGDTVFWLPFFHATNADFGTLARGYFRLLGVSLIACSYYYPTRSRDFAGVSVLPDNTQPDNRSTARNLGHRPVQRTAIYIHLV